jgi:aminopeptidase N
MYDLLNLSLDMVVDYPDRLLTATATNTLSPLRDSVTQLRFHAGVDTKIEKVELNGTPATFKRDDEGILVDCPPTKRGEKDVVTVHYHLMQSEEVHGGSGGWHWHEPKKNDPSKVGLWTNGETSDTRDWAVTWDYPNDFTTSETRTTVPADWEVISNGTLISDTVNPGGKTRTVYWKMDQSHATYLTSVICGPFDIHKDTWRGKPLYYVCPKGMGAKLDYSFGHTKDMLSFYSDNLGVEYPWPKYAQDCTYDFGGGQENVSATTLGAAFLTDPRAGYYTMDSLNSHEMGHQWFGDYVTCKDWGQIWLNESFATFMEMSYTLHILGENAGYREFEANSQGYFDESRRYKRPIATNFYSNPGVMFDQHTYPKGGALLISLRKELGWKPFYSGLKLYIERFHNGPAETNDLCEAMTDATGINLHPWFDQWILKPGHPVIDWSWSYDDAAKKVTVHVKQTQDTTQGTPIYDVPTKVGFIMGSQVLESPIHLNSAGQSFSIDVTAKPDAVMFDPTHDFVRQIETQPWGPSELVPIAKYAPDCVLRQQAMDRVLGTEQPDSAIPAIVEMLKADQGLNPAILNTSALARLKRPELRSFWFGELKHENFERREHAVRALSELPNDAETNNVLQGLLNDSEPYRVVAASITALGALDYANSHDLIYNQAAHATNGQIRGAGLAVLVKHDDPKGVDLVFDSLGEMQPDEMQSAGLNALAYVKGNDSRVVKFVREAINSGNFRLIQTAMQVAVARKMKEVIPDLKALEAKNPRVAGFIEPIIQQIQGRR